MKAQNMKLYMLLCLLLICQINTQANTFQEIVHEDSELAKVCTLEDQSVLVLSTILGVQRSKESLLDKTGDVLYGNITLQVGYTGNAQLVQPHSVNGKQPDHFLSGHNKQNIDGKLAKEFYTEFSRGSISRNFTNKNNIFDQQSTVALKSGKVFVAGINKVEDFGAQRNVEVNIFDPIKNKWGPSPLTLNDAYSRYISCYEQKANEVYCVYVSWEEYYVSKLRIKHITIDDTAMTFTVKDSENKQIIKNFYTVFNFIKAIRYNDNEAIVVFQTGNGQKLPRYGNTGKDLYYYHLLVNGDSVSVKRYEYLYDQCERIDDPEDYKVDVAVLSDKRIYVTCETGIGRFRGFEINPEVEKIEEFNFNNFDAETVKNPVFAKFDKSLGIFYTHRSVTQKSTVAFHLMNYPYCRNDGNTTYTIPKYFSYDSLNFYGKVFMNNPYPFSRANEEVDIRFKSHANITVINLDDNKDIVIDKDYKPELSLKIIPEKNLEEYYSLEYTATRKDKYDGLIVGRTCKVNFYTPKCLPQCYSCSRTGTDEHHYCLGCAEGAFYKEDDPEAINDGFGKPHNCYPCDKACSSCYGAFLYKPKTTNCKKCDYKNGYYHFVNEERTCISYETKEEWEQEYGPIYLDKTPGEGKEEEWRWRLCHKNCASCSGPGNDTDNQCDTCKTNSSLYFYCNQTKGDGIPGSCHDNCVNNGFFLKESENMEKCCPCLDGCKICQNVTKCDQCFKPHYLMPDHESCVDDCGYCLAKDDQLMECVNCKTRYLSPKYNLNGTCYDEIPEITYEDPDVKGKKHHVLDDQCNLLIGCKEGCFNCSLWYTEKCTKCFPEFYKEDHFPSPDPPIFPCFKEKECQGIEPYQFDKNFLVSPPGGVPKILNGEGVCYNCRYREGSYRQVENNFTCGPKAKRTYVNITHYNKLSQCYPRCATCDGYGNSCFHNCLTCRDPSLYGLVPYKNDPLHGDCIRYTHKCKDLPYYHDYDIADQLGIDEDNCGQDCDVCLTNRTCTPNFPYYVAATRECVELCPLTDVLSQACLMNHTNAGFLLLQNPFDLPNPYLPINQTVNINQIISSSIFQKFAESYNINVNEAKEEINNVLGNGKIYNLPHSEVIIGNNISIELTSVKLELEKLVNSISGTTTTEAKNKTSILDVSECEAILKKKYGISDEEDLMIIKGDTLKQLSEQYLGTQVDYQLFSSSLGAFLPLSDCKEGNATATVTNPFSIDHLISQFASKTGAVLDNGYDVFNSESPFYNDVCTPFTNENGNDVLLDERRSDYFSEVLNICENGCTFVEYNITTNLYSCKCPIKDTINQQNEEEVITKELPESFYKKHKNSNIEVFKCSSQVFSSEGQKKNYGSYVLLTCLASFIGVVVYYIIKGPSKINLLFNNLAENQIVANPPNPKSVATKPDPNDIKKGESNSKNEISNEKPIKAMPDNVINEEQLNNDDYNIALSKDKRGYLKLYWSLLKMKQLFIFTFYTYTDYNLRIAKIALFILFVSFYFAFTALFFNDNIMRQIYIYKGNTDAAVHVPNIILSSLCCLIMNFIVRFVSLSERDISKINCERSAEEKKKLCDRTKKILKIKLIVLFAISAVLIGLCWYYVAAFCAVFKNSQGHYLVNVLVAFIVCNIWPCVTSLIPPVLRIQGLKNKSPCMYKVSQILAYI